MVGPEIDIIFMVGLRNGNLGFRGLENVSNKKDLSKKIFFFANFSNVRKKFEKKINIEVNNFTSK